MTLPGGVAQLMMDLIAAGTPEKVPMTDDAVMWHNYDQTDWPAAETIANFAAIRAVFRDCRFENVRTASCGSVSLAQWDFTLTLLDGSVLRAPGCFVVHERDGRIFRVEEYMDSAQLAPVAAAVTERTAAAE
jgi:uncharacterized protein